MRAGLAVGDDFAGLDVLAFEHRDLRPLRDQLLDLVAVAGDDLQALLALGGLAEADGAAGFGQNRRVLRLARLEQVGDARQTAGDVARLALFLRDTGDDVTHLHFGAILDVDDGLGRQRVGGRDVGAGEGQFLALGVDQAQHRAQVLAGGTAGLRIGDHQRAHAGDVVGLAGDGDAVLEVLEAHDTGDFRDDRVGMRVPAGQTLAGLHGLAFGHQDDGAVRHLVTLALAAVGVHHADFTGAGGGNAEVFLVLHRLQVVLAHRTGGAGVNAVGGNGTGGRATDVEGTHGQLRARLADRLRRDDADSLADVDQVATRQVAAVALAADAEGHLAGDGGTHPDFVDGQLFQLVDQRLVEQRAGLDGDSVAARDVHVAQQGAAEHAVAQRFQHVAAFHDRTHHHALLGAAVLGGHHHVLGDIDQAAGQVTGVGGLQRGIGQTLTGAVGGDEVLQDVQTLAEVRGDRRLDDRTVRLGHQAAHAGQLTDLGGATARTGVGHHEHRVEARLFRVLAVAGDDFFLADLRHHRLGDVVVGLGPDVDHVVVTLGTGGQTLAVLVVDVLHLGLGFGQDAHLLFRHHDVVEAERDARLGRHAEAGVHQLIGEDHRVLHADAAVHVVDDAADFLLGQRLVDGGEGDVVGQDLGQQGAAGGGVHQAEQLLAVVVEIAQAHLDLGLQVQRAGLVGAVHFGHVGADHALARGGDALTRHPVQTQHHVLRRHDDGVAVGGRQDVVGGHHQHARFQLRFQRQRHVHGHLVAVEVGVEGGADQRMQLDRLAFDQHRLERLDAQTMQRRGAVEQHRMFADALFQDVPHHRFLALDHLLGRLDGGGQALALQQREHERLEQLQRHLLGQAALVQLQRRADHDDRTARVVDALAQQVLAEATLLALDHVGQRLEGALVGAGDGTAAATVVDQRIHRFLQHALFVAHDDVRRGQLEQTLEPVVAVDDAAVQVVQVGGGETAAIQRHQRTQVRRQHRQHRQHHPLRLVVGGDQVLDQLEALAQLLDLGVGAGARDFLAQLDRFLLQVQALEQVMHRLGAHAGVELVAVLLDRVEVVLFGQQGAALERGQARVDHDVGFEIQHALDRAQRHVQQQADARRQRLEEPDVRHRRGQLDVAHALAAHLGHGHFDAALLAHHAAVLEALVLAAQALVVLDRPEDLGAEQAIALGLEGAVVDGLRLLHFTVGPGTDGLRGGQADLDRVEVLEFLGGLHQIKKVFHLLLQQLGALNYRVNRIRTGASADQPFCSSSMLRPIERISLTSTLNDSGMPACMR